MGASNVRLRLFAGDGLLRGLSPQAAAFGPEVFPA
jgi:hypothetical protein